MVLQFINSVVQKMGPLWTHDWFRIPVGFMVMICCVCLVKFIIKGHCSDV